MIARGEEVTPYSLAEATKISLHTIMKCLDQMSFAEKVHIDSTPFLAEALDDEIETKENSPEALFIQKEEAEAISRAIGQLPVQTRKVILLKYGFETGEQVPDSKVAEIMQLNKNQVRRLLTSGQRALEASLKRERLFQSRIIRQEIDNQEIAFIPKTTKEEISDAKMFMEMNDVGF